MRNKYPGICYRCAKLVEKKAGHFERVGTGWRVQHADCAIKYRGYSYIHPDVIKKVATQPLTERGS